jgi:hypothetical protein
MTLARRGPTVSWLAALVLALAGGGAGPDDDREADLTAVLQRRLDDSREGTVVTLRTGTHTSGPLRVPRGVRLLGEPGAVLRLRDGVVDPKRGTALITLDSNAELEGLTLDGNTAGNPAEPAPSFGTALVVLAPGSRGARVAGCTLRDAPRFGLFGNAAADARIVDNRFEGTRDAAILLQNGAHRPLIDGNRFNGCLGSAIKIDAGDGAHPHGRLEAPVVRDNWIDYRGAATRPESLAIEFWTETKGDPGVVGGLIRGNTVWGPTAPGAAPIYGISLGGCTDSRCTENLLYGPNLAIGIETADAIRPIVAGNIIDGAAIGWSASQLCRQPSFLGNKLRRCSRFGAQLIDETTEPLIHDNTWLDAGSDRMLFLNDAGRNASIQGNLFLLEHAPKGPRVAALYVFGRGARGTLFRNNICRPVPGGSGDQGLLGVYLNDAAGVVVEGNDFDPSAPSGLAPQGGAAAEAEAVAGLGHGNTVRNNTLRKPAAEEEPGNRP